MKYFNSSAPTTAAALIPILAQSPEPDGRPDPLISRGSDVAIYIGIAILIIAAAFAVRSLNYRVEYAIFFALFLAGILIAVILFI